MRAIWLCFVLVFAILVAGCGGSGPGATAALKVTPGDTGLLPNETVQLAAIPAGGSFEPVVWSVVGGSANGTVTTDGLYRAPATTGTFQVRVALKDNPGVSATATINVASTITVSILPVNPKPRYTSGNTVIFVPSVTGQSAQSVRWQASGGFITETGQFTAPATPGVYVVTATSLRDSSKAATYNVVVSDTPVVRMDIQDKGSIWIRMATAEAPNTTANFQKLAREGFYNGSVFHRYGPDEGQPAFIQGGDPNTKTKPLTDPSIGTGTPGYTINFEANPLQHKVGAIAMARGSSLNSAGCQFYICHQDIPGFDGDYVIFGKVIGGLSVATSLRRGDKLLEAAELN